jgi:predicted Zn-dependent protease
MRPTARSFALVVFAASLSSAQLTTEKELSLGRHMAAEIDSKYAAIGDTEVTGYVDRVLQRLSQNEALRLPLSLRIIHHSEA